MDVNPMRKLSTQLYRLAQLIENLEHRINGTEVQLAQYCNTGRQLPAPEMMH